jgi:hypothetical protein
MLPSDKADVIFDKVDRSIAKTKVGPARVLTRINSVIIGQVPAAAGRAIRVRATSERTVLRPVNCCVET